MNDDDNDNVTPFVRPERTNVTSLTSAGGKPADDAVRPLNPGIPDVSGPPGKLEVTVTYVEMKHVPAPRPRPHRAESVSVLRAEKPTVSFYRYLYYTVGAPWLWYERRIIDDDALREIIESEWREIYVLYVGGVPAGFTELDRFDTDNVEVAYFGLMPDFIGRALGPYFLDWTVQRAWLPPRGEPAKRIWLHTCTLDHPKALRTYQRAGFGVYDQHTFHIDDPRATITFD